MANDKKTTLEIFKAKASAALKRKRNFITFTLEFPSFAKDEDGEPLAIKFKTLNDDEVNDCIGFESDESNASDKYAIYLASVEPNLKELGMAMKDAGEISTPFEIMNMFELHEIIEASTIIMKESGVIAGDKKVSVIDKGIENLKN